MDEVKSFVPRLFDSKGDLPKMSTFVKLKKAFCKANSTNTFKREGTYVHL